MGARGQGPHVAVGLALGPDRAHVHDDAVGLVVGEVHRGEVDGAVHLHGLGDEQAEDTDDHAATLRRWRGLLEPEFEIVGTVGDGESLVSEAERLAPDVIVTDVSMPGMSGLAAAGAILRRHPAARIVFATVHADNTMLRRGLAVGAMGYVLKVRAGDDIVPAVRAASTPVGLSSMTMQWPGATPMRSAASR